MDFDSFLVFYFSGKLSLKDHINILPFDRYTILSLHLVRLTQEAMNEK
jgi:hypothetical protein